MLSTFLQLPFVFLLFLGACLPSDGSHGLLHPKSLSFLGAIAAMIVSLFCRTHLRPATLRLFLGYIAFLGFLVVFAAVGALHSSREAVLDQGKLFFITGTTAFLVLWHTSEEGWTFPRLLALLLFANGLFSLSKAVLFALHFIGLVDMWSLMEQTGLRYMTMEMAGSFDRLQTSVDILTPYLLYFALQHDRFGLNLSKTTRMAYVCLASFSIMASFSRFLFLVALVSLSLHVASVSLLKKVRAFFFVGVLTSAVVGLVGVDNVLSLVEVRVLSQANADSDSVRKEQADALWATFLETPVFGKGLGGSSSYSLREEDEAMQHSYEVQWLAFLMQFGVVGVTILGLFLVALAAPFVQAPFSKEKAACIVLFLFWVASGLTNPYLVSLTSGIFYGFIGACGQSLLKQKDCPDDQDHSHPSYLI